MKILSALAVLLCFLCPFSGQAAEARHVRATGGEIALTFYTNNVRNAGLLVEGPFVSDLQTDEVSLAILPASNLSLATNDGFFDKLVSGDLKLAAGLSMSAGKLNLPSEQIQIVPVKGKRDTLWLADAVGRRWFYLDYGHFELQRPSLHGRYMDVRIAGDLAEMMGKPELQGYLIGAANLQTTLQATQPVAQRITQPITFQTGINKLQQQSGELFPDGGIAPSCPVASPNWPTEAGYDADIAMLEIEYVDEVARSGGRVAIVPTAYFENVGTADVPWFAQFADTLQVDACCVDQGNGACEPYQNDQGGLLVYHLYRMVDGRIEQLAQSGVKHAFNSINVDTDLGTVACRARNRSGRVVPSGCEDLYQAYSNANQHYLGPRDEVIAHQAIWQRDNSIWDKTGPNGVPDGNCDYMPDSPLYGGQVPCMAPATDVLERRMSVSEAELLTTGGRYFIEAWYLVRDDVNVFNSFGTKEIAPFFDGNIWMFPEVQAFRSGPIIDEFIHMSDNDAQLEGPEVLAVESDIVDTGEGILELATKVSKISDGQWRYDFALMNIDFDRAIDGFDIPVPAGMNVLETGFFDGDAESGNDWEVSFPPGMVNFQAPDGMALKWGTLVSFRLVADRAPAEAVSELKVAEPGVTQKLTIKTLSGVPLVFENSFEQ